MKNRAFFNVDDWTFVNVEKKEKRIELKEKEFFYNWNSFQETMNKKTTIDERIKFINEAKFINFSSENKIHER